MNKISVGVIGCGYFGPNYIRIAHELINCNMNYCADIKNDKLKKTKKLYPAIKTTLDYNNILNDSLVDAVIIATNPSTHYKIVKDALNKKKHVLVEKPLTLSSKECLKLKKLAQKNKKILMVAHTYDYNSALRSVKALLRKKNLGELIYVNFLRKGLGPIRGDINAMWDLMPHDISIMLRLIEEKPVSVSATGVSHIKKSKPDVVFLTFKFKKNFIVTMQASWLDPYKTRNISFVGDKKMLIFEDTSVNEKIKIINKGIGYQKQFVNFGEFQSMVSAGDVTIPQIEMKEPLKEQVKHFFECISKNKKPLSGPDEAIAVVKVLEFAQESLDKKGKEINIKF
jgi:predicted dehydrogenase